MARSPRPSALWSDFTVCASLPALFSSRRCSRPRRRRSTSRSRCAHEIRRPVGYVVEIRATGSGDERLQGRPVSVSVSRATIGLADHHAPAIGAPRGSLFATGSVSGRTVSYEQALRDYSPTYSTLTAAIRRASSGSTTCIAATCRRRRRAATRRTAGRRTTTASSSDERVDGPPDGSGASSPWTGMTGADAEPPLIAARFGLAARGAGEPGRTV